MDWIPGLSQAKSLVQVICGDKEGAKKTQENFLNTCPIVSQGKSLTQSILGDDEGALETQKAFGRTMSGVANGIPVLGHAKGVIHYAFGDKEGGDQAMKSSSRTIGVMGGGVGGFFVGGPVGAVAGGIAGGIAMDGITTGIDSAVHDEYRPAGHIAAVTEIVNSDKNPSGKIFDLTCGVAFDGLTGQAAGTAAGQIANNIKANNIRTNAKAAFEQVENNPSATSGELASAGKTAMTELKRADGIQGIKTDFTKFGEPVTTKPSVFSEPTFVPVNETADEEKKEILPQKTFTEFCELASKSDGENRRVFQNRIDGYVTQMINIINSELVIYNQSFESLLQTYKNKKKDPDSDSDSDDEDDENHTLLTQNEANELINYFELNSNGNWTSYLLSTFIVGGSYGSLDSQYENRKRLYEINHLPPDNSYKGTRYNKISYSKMPAHLMKYEHHRIYPTTGTRNFPYDPLRNWSAGAYRFMLKFLLSINFAAALRLELRMLFLLFPESYQNLYGPGALQLINYCRTERIKGAPCNTDCVYYGRH